MERKLRRSQKNLSALRFVLILARSFAHAIIIHPSSSKALDFRSPISLLNRLLPIATHRFKILLTPVICIHQITDPIIFIIITISIIIIINLR
jgi:hypothetical protein